MEQVRLWYRKLFGLTPRTYNVEFKLKWIKDVPELSENDKIQFVLLRRGRKAATDLIAIPNVDGTTCVDVTLSLDSTFLFKVPGGRGRHAADDTSGAEEPSLQKEKVTTLLIKNVTGKVLDRIVVNLPQFVDGQYKKTVANLKMLGGAITRVEIETNFLHAGYRKPAAVLAEEYRVENDKLRKELNALKEKDERQRAKKTETTGTTYSTEMSYSDIVDELKKTKLQLAELLAQEPESRRA